MTDHFDRAPGAGRNRMKQAEVSEEESAREESRLSFFNQHEPLRQPRTSPPAAERDGHGDTWQVTRSTPVKQDNAITPTAKTLPFPAKSTLSVDAPEFYPSSYECYQEDPEDYYGEATLADLVQDFMYHLSTSPGSFEVDVEQITATLNMYVNTEESLRELVELIYTQSTSIPNFAYTGARLCNHLSRHLAFSSSRGNFRQLLLMRCHKEFEQTEHAVKADGATQRSFHSYVLFLGELYLHLEVKGPSRAEILLEALRKLMDALFCNPTDANLICGVKLLKLTGSVLEDAWKKSHRTDMEELISKIKMILLDNNCSRDVKQMLLRLVELRSSDWGRVCVGATAKEATPENDPNYYMNEPTFYTADGTPFTAADPDYSEKYQELLEQQDYFPDFNEENGNEVYLDDDDEMDPEIQEAFEKFCMESERKGHP